MKKSMNVIWPPPPSWAIRVHIKYCKASKTNLKRIIIWIAGDFLKASLNLIIPNEHNQLWLYKLRKLNYWKLIQFFLYVYSLANKIPWKLSLFLFSISPSVSFKWDQEQKNFFLNFLFIFSVIKWKTHKLPTILGSLKCEFDKVLMNDIRKLDVTLFERIENLGIEDYNQR